jgi:diaminopimelate epimerase
MRFAKAHAYGNDFLYVERPAVNDLALDALAREMCHRHEGIGADGLIVYERAGDRVSMQLFNADGGRAEMSGNGVRALGALILHDDPRASASLVVETQAGSKHLTRLDRHGTRQTFRASMGCPADIREVTLHAAGESVSLVVLNMGNPQSVVLGPLPGEERFRRLGAALERHAAFPDGTNVEFAEVETPNRIRILIWERGVGPTTSSGTGSCAALVAAASYGGANREADVIAPGGAQRVEWGTHDLYLTGWAEVVCEGEWLKQIPRTRP